MLGKGHEKVPAFLNTVDAASPCSVASPQTVWERFMSLAGKVSARGARMDSYLKWKVETACPPSQVCLYFERLRGLSRRPILLGTLVSLYARSAG